jgi:protein-disulfide isomerase
VTDDTSQQTGPSGVMEPLDPEIDHVRGGATGRLLVEYGDYECPYSRAAYREIQRLEHELGDAMRFAFRHFPLTEIHPHAAAAAAAAEAAALQSRFWEMHDHLYHHQHSLEDQDLRSYASDLGLDVEQFDADRGAEAVLERVVRDFRSGMETGEVRGTPTLFIDGSVHLGAYELDTLREAMTRR